MNGFPTTSTEALQLLQGSNGFTNPPDRYTPPLAPFRQSSQPPMHPMAAGPQQNWMPQTMPQNHYPQPPAVQHSQYPAAWQNQMQPQGFPNGIPGIPFFPQQVIHDAFALSHPVQLADEPVLLRALFESRSKGETFKDALNRLHGIGGHSASLWKDYYLDNKDKLDTALQSFPDAPGLKKTVKKPSIANFKTESSPFSTSAMSSSSPVPRRQNQQVAKPTRIPSHGDSSRRTESISSHRESSQRAESHHRASSSSNRAESSRAGSSRRATSSHDEIPTSGRRRTINSLTSHTLVYNERLPPPNTELKIPEPPSRSPSPPTEAIPHNRGGHKFTPADRAYFIKFIQWRLKSDPTLTRSELCEALNEKAPHHSTQSWASYWQSHHDLPDKILASVRDSDQTEEPDEEQRKPKKAIPQRRPNYKESSSSSELTESEDDEQESEQDEEDDEGEDDDDNSEVPAFDESAMGPTGGSFTRADLGGIVRHIASFSEDEFTEFTMQERFGDFARRYPQRTLKSWNEYYRRNKKTIDKLVSKIRTLDESEAERPKRPAPLPSVEPPTPAPLPPVHAPLPPAVAPMPLPTPKPSWITENTGSHSGPPRAKRKFGVEEDLVENSEKRMRAQGTI